MSKIANDANKESLHNKIAPNESPDPNAKKRFLKPLIWIEKNIDEENEENKMKKKELNVFNLFNIKYFNNLDEGLNEISTLKFRSLIVVVCGEFIKDFFIQINDNLSKINVIPKVLMLINEKNKNEIIKRVNHYPFFNEKYIFDDFSKLNTEILSDDISKYFAKEKNLIFNTIDNLKELTIPLYYPNIINMSKKPSDEEIKAFNELLYKEFDSNKGIKDLLYPTFQYNIPLELLIKFWLRLYSISSFAKIINDHLINNDKDFNIYTSIFYLGLNNGIIKPFFEKKLFRGAAISEKEYKSLKSNFSERKTICFISIFLKFNVDEKIPLEFLKNKKNIKKEDEKLIFFEIQEGEKIDDNNVSNTDIQKFSVHEDRKEILFFPYSSFEILSIDDKNENKEGFIRIKLSYLGKYRKDVSGDVKKWKDIKIKGFFKKFIESKIAQGGIEKIEKDNPEAFVHNILEYFVKNRKKIIHTERGKNIFPYKKSNTRNIDNKGILKYLII